MNFGTYTTALQNNEHVFRYSINCDGSTCLKGHIRIAIDQLFVPYTTHELNKIKEIIIKLMIPVRDIRDPTCLHLANLMLELTIRRNC